MPKENENVVSVLKRLEKLIPKFMDYQKANLAALEKAQEINNFHEIAKLGHIIKGAAGSYGFDEMTMIGNAIELAAKEASVEKVGLEIKRYRDYLQAVKIKYI